MCALNLVLYIIDNVCQNYNYYVVGKQMHSVVLVQGAHFKRKPGPFYPPNERHTSIHKTKINQLNKPYVSSQYVTVTDY
jgi:hypothetical protein